MLKRLISVILILCMMCSLFCACGEEEEINAIFPINADPECLDPQIAENDSAKLIVYNCMEGLVRVDADGAVKPGVAESWSVSSDGLTYTFKIRDDSCWQMLKTHKNVLGEDYESAFSTKVTAADCAFGIERALRPETKAENAYLLFPIKNAQKFNAGEVKRNNLGIEVVNDSTLIIHLERACPDLLRILAEPMCMPCDEEFFNATGAKYGLELKYTLCNGPYYVGRWVDDGSLTLYRNEQYSGYKPIKTNAVYLYVNSDEKQYISKFNQGDYNAMKVSPENISLVNANDDIITLSSSNDVYGFVFNCEDSVLSDINIRKALLAATDISAMYHEDSGLTPAKGIVPDTCKWGEDNYRDVAGKVSLPEYSPQKASEFFKDGLEALETTNINISIICEKEFRTAVIRLIQKWEKAFGLAITVSVDTLETDELNSSVKKGEYQIALTKLSAKDGNTLSFLNTFTSDNAMNFAKYQSEDYDGIINSCKTKFAGNDLVKKYRSAEQMLVNEGVFYPVYSAENHAYVTEDLEGVFGLPGFTCFDFAVWGDGNEN
ncbi:MAG: peptide ABC transporter substrate-binding protein [Clostridia bacterium]|nr:peptide ABC transporter substrate-binding protein [Clostridia bacterium]